MPVQAQVHVQAQVQAALRALPSVPSGAPSGLPATGARFPLPASLPPCRRRACAPRPLQRPLAAAEAQVSGRRGSAAPRGAAPSRAGPGWTRGEASGSSGGSVEPRWSRRGRPVPYVTPGPSARRAGPADPNGPQRSPTAPGTAGTSPGELGGGWEVTIKRGRAGRVRLVDQSPVLMSPYS